MSDLIRIKRGLAENLPELMQGEMGFTTDTEDLYVGGVLGNVKITQRKEEYYLFIGDSYDEYSGWIPKTAQIMGLTSGTYWNLAVSGSNFGSGWWLNLLTDWVNAHPNEAKKIDVIVCGGGINDSDSTNFPKLSNALTAFKTYCTANLPNAKIKLAYFGWALDTSSILAGRTANYRLSAQQLYGRAEGFGMEYLSGCEMVLHDRTLLNADGLHPTAEGGARIAECVSNALKTGYASVTYYNSSTFTPVSGTATGLITQTMSGGQVVTTFDFVGINATSLSFSGNSWTKMGDLKLALGNKIPQTQIRVMMQNAGGTNKTYDTEIKVVNDELLCRINEIDPATSSFVSTTAVVIQAFAVTTSSAGIND